MTFLLSHLWRIRRNCFCHAVSQVKKPSSFGAVVRLSSWVLLLRCSSTGATIWEQRWRQQESGGSTYWELPKGDPALPGLLVPGASSELSPVLGEAALSPYPMTQPPLLFSTPTFRGTYFLRWNGLPWKCWSRKQNINESSWACFLD